MKPVGWWAHAWEFLESGTRLGFLKYEIAHPEQSMTSRPIGHVRFQGRVEAFAGWRSTRGHRKGGFRSAQHDAARFNKCRKAGLC